MPTLNKWWQESFELGIERIRMTEKQRTEYVDSFPYPKNKLPVGSTYFRGMEIVL